ncbi:hypothetical protein [Streptomyces sp. MA15]|uniref:hypothetical protein n=1 Tax=Streptomyces sp. MA15 TaxID=3055061 RepID=UPI0025B1A678|nr:hypothetical protein [Streptomyces sp. MA15]MDN3270355.1 hypothetical protein [Streptomyces sp. MA15]
MSSTHGPGGTPRRGPRKTLARVGWALAVLGVMGASAVMSAPSASADGAESVRNWQNGRCLEADSIGYVFSSPCQPGNTYQQWYMHVEGPVGTGVDAAMFVNTATDQVL